MKAKNIPDIFSLKNVKKILLKKNLAILLMLLSATSLNAISLVSENASISVQMQSVTVREVGEEIEKQGGISFFYNDNLPELNRWVSVSFDETPIKDVLENALSHADMTYEEIRDDFVVLLSKPDNISQQQITVAGQVTDSETNEGLPGVSIVIAVTSIGVATDT